MVSDVRYCILKVLLNTLPALSYLRYSQKSGYVSEYNVNKILLSTNYSEEFNFSTAIISFSKTHFSSCKVNVLAF